jgi:hypothetical protein
MKYDDGGGDDTRNMGGGAKKKQKVRGVGRDRVEKVSLGGARRHHIGAAMKQRIRETVVHKMKGTHTLLSSRHR